MCVNDYKNLAFSEFLHVRLRGAKDPYFKTNRMYKNASYSKACTYTFYIIFYWKTTEVTFFSMII